MKITEEYNLGKLYPNLVKEWHPTKNKRLTPFQVAPASRKKVWWLCKQGHEWEASVYNRKYGGGCPYCSGKKPTKEYNFAVVHPDLAEEWHPTKNGKLKPEDVMPASRREVWWKCKEGHEWKSSLEKRHTGSICPACYEQKRGEIRRKAAIKKSGSLAEKHPQIAKQWHPTKNGNFTPYDFAPKSHKKIWWKCNFGHEWKSEISNRTSGSGCPHCHPQTSKREIRIFCEFKSIFNDVRWKIKIDGIECDIYLPTYKVGIELDGYPWHEDREENDKRKGKTFRKKGITLFHIRDNRLKEITPRDIFYSYREKHIIIIKRILKNLMKNLSLSNEEKKKISDYLQVNQLQNQKEFREIAKLLPAPIPEKSLATIFPEIADEWHIEKNKPLNPTMFTPKSSIKVWWKCSEGHEWKTHIYSRTNGNGCPYCSGRNPTKENNLAVLNTKLAKEWHPTKNKGLTPFQLTPRSEKKVWWICDKGHEWKSTVSNRTIGRGCPYCAGKRVSKDNNLKVMFPELAKEWHPTKNGKLNPTDVTKGQRKKVWWKCKEGHEWQAAIYSRTSGRGCPYCAGRRLEINNLAIKFPKLIEEWHPTKNGKLTPYDFAPKSHKKIWWKCKQGHVWEARIAGRTRGRGCPYCAGQRATKENNLAKRNPELAKEWHPTKNGKLKPEDLMPHSGKKVWWMCEKGHEWEASLDNRSRGTGCPYCAGKRKV